MRYFMPDFHMKSGMKYLIESFYRSIVEDTPVPIPYREILLTARIMDAIFAQLDRKRSEGKAHAPRSLDHALTDSANRILHAFFLTRKHDHKSRAPHCLQQPRDDPPP